MSTNILNVVAIRHLAFEDAGLLALLLAQRGATLSYVEAPTLDWAAFDPLAPDLLVVLGGPIGVYETDAYPFLIPEIEAVRARLTADRPTLGVCLGAQLMAVALGASVAPGPEKEIGYAPMMLSAAGQASPLAAVAQDADGYVLHWHGDQMTLPEGCELLASSAVTPVQAFARGTRQLALQFHVETPPEALESWYVGHAAEIAAMPGIDPQNLRAQAARHGAAVAAAGRRVLSDWLGDLSVS